MGIYFNNEPAFIKGLLEKEQLTPSEQNRLDNYNKIVAIKEKLRNMSKEEYTIAKTNFEEESSNFYEVVDKLNNMEKKFKFTC